MNKKTSKKAEKENSPKVEQYLYSVGWSEADAAFVARWLNLHHWRRTATRSKMPCAKLKMLSDLCFPIYRKVKNRFPNLSERAHLADGWFCECPNICIARLALDAMQQGVSLNQLLNLKLESSR